MTRMQNLEEFMGDKRLWFFEIINDKLRTTKRLILPSKFVKNLSEVPDCAALKGPSGVQRNVKLSKNENSIYLEEGWRQFVRDNSLGKDEFLIFRYSRAKKFFDIQIFERSGVERVHGDTNRGREGSFLPLRKNPYAEHSPREPSRPNTTMKDKVVSHSRKVNEDRGNGKDKKQTTIKTLPKKTYQRLPLEEKDKALLQRALNSFNSTFPYFWICMRQSYVGKGIHLPIPRAFVRDYLDINRREMILQNPQGKSWEVECIYSLGALYISKGWPAFVSANNFKVGDMCIFELVAANKFQVHVFV